MAERSDEWLAESIDHQEFVNEILNGAPESWDDDAAAEGIAIDYVRELERRVLALGGTLEKWEESDRE